MTSTEHYGFLSELFRIRRDSGFCFGPVGRKVAMVMVSGLCRLGLLAALVAAGLMLGTPAARSQPVLCGERTTVLKQLKLKFGEQRTAFGLTEDGRLVEVFAGPSGSWTILMTAPGGRTCLMTSGGGWREIDTTRDGQVA